MRLKRALFLVGAAFLGAALALLRAEMPAHRIVATTLNHETTSSPLAAVAPATSHPTLPPPRLQGQSGPADSPGKLVTEPTAPGYDAADVAKFSDDLRAVFEAEPRDPIWAAKMEAVARRQFSEDITRMVAASKIRALSCRTASCSIEFDVPAGQAVDFGHALQVMGYGHVSEVTQPDSTTVRLRFFLAKEQRELEPYREWQKRVRAARMERLAAELAKPGRAPPTGSDALLARLGGLVD